MGKVVIPAGSFGLSTTISQGGANLVAIEGAPADSVDYNVCTTRLTALTSGMTMISLVPSGTNSVGGGLGHLCLEGSGATAATGVKLRSVVGGLYEDVAVRDVSVNAWDLDVLDHAGGLLYDNSFVHDNIALYAQGALTANGWLLGQGSATVDVSDNRWFGGLVQYQHGQGFDCGGADSNSIFGMDIQPLDTLQGYSLYLRGHSTDYSRTCRSNRFITSGGFGRSANTAPYFDSASAQPTTRNVIYQNLESGAVFSTPTSPASATITDNRGDYWSNVGNGFASIGGSVNLTSATVTPNSILIPNAGYFETLTSSGVVAGRLHDESSNKTYLDGGTGGLVLRDNNSANTIGSTTGNGVFGWNAYFVPKAYTVATLPSCTGLTGAFAYVSDAVAPTYNGALTGGGSVRVPVFCNGTSWVAH